MTVTNKTSVNLEILGGILAPNESREYTEMMFNTLTFTLRLEVV